MSRASGPRIEWRADGAGWKNLSMLGMMRSRLKYSEYGSCLVLGYRDVSGEILSASCCASSPFSW